MTSRIHIKVAVAYEGGLDTAYIEVILRRIVELKGFAISEIDLKKVGTAIVKFVPAYAKVFNSNGVQLAVFLTDGDDGSNTIRQIREAVEKGVPALLESTAIGVPEPHIEDWILRDQNAVKAILVKPECHDEPLSYADLRPKERLIALYNESEYSGTLEEAKISIANIANFDVMTASKEFRAFKADIERVLTTIKIQGKLDI